MYLIQILLPLSDNSGQRFSANLFEEVANELTARFGGMTAYSRSPAEGRCRTGKSEQQDDVVVVEVMVEDLDRVWWTGFRWRLETTFRQESLIIRAGQVELI